MRTSDQIQHTQVYDFPPNWASSWGDDKYGLWADLSIISKGITATQKMRWIEPSQEKSFFMGSSQAERDKIKDQDSRDWANQTESDPYAVYIEKGFWLANTPCTQSFWMAITGNNPSHFKNKEKIDLTQTHQLPLENVAYADDTNKELSIQYFLQCLNQYLKVSSTTAHLPTEIEWEYTCRADTETAYWWGDDYLAGRANIDETGDKKPMSLEGSSAVNSYQPNPWGLYDMHGNVWEWTSSVWKKKLNVEGVIEEAGQRVARGGSWIDLPDNVRSSSRINFDDQLRIRTCGFRFLLRT